MIKFGLTIFLSSVFSILCFAQSGVRIQSTSASGYVSLKSQQVAATPKSASNATSTSSDAVVEKVSGPAVTKSLNAPLKSDIDVNIPLTSKVNSNTYALIIGNEDYSKVGEPSVPFAKKDAEIFAKYVERTLGVPRENIIIKTDLTSAMLYSEIERFCNIVKTHPFGNQRAEVLFYYAGHGLPDEKKQSYICPVDVSEKMIARSGIKTQELYHQLSDTGAKKITVFLDACFSGSETTTARGMRVTPNKDVLSGNLVVFAATKESQKAESYMDKGHGLFTYFILKKIQETKGNIKYEDLYNYVSKSVLNQSYKIYSEQNPTIIASPDAESKWRTWSL